MANVVLKRGREKPVRLRHPWVFSGAVARTEGDPADGNVIEVVDADGRWLARGIYNSASQIRVRLLTWDPAQPVDRDFWQRRLAEAVDRRQRLAADPSTDAYRLVHAESDGLPGLIVDRYGGWVVMQCLTLGIEQRKHELAELLAGLVRPHGIYERSDVDVREQEGIARVTGVLWGAEPPTAVEIVENGYRFLVDLREGHKTGFYLDQRENRERLQRFSAGAEVLNAFAYTGAFGVYAAAAGAARVINVDTSAEALALAERNFVLNRLSADRLENVQADVFSHLRTYRAAGQQFDLIVLDPPKFAPSQQELSRATRGYKDINWLAFQLLRPGGILFTFSCSGAMSADLFQKVVFGAMMDAGRQAQIIGAMTQGPDHPVALTFPEGAYLKGLICRVL